jgi:neutral ceramidase
MWIEAEGMLLAEEVLRVAQGLDGGESDVRIAGAQKTVSCPGRTRTNQGREGQPGMYTDGPDVNMLIGVLGVGEVGLAHINAEVYNAVGQGIKANSPMANTVFVGFANGSANSGCIPTDDAYCHNTFQVLGSRLKPGCAENAIENTMVDMLTQYATGFGTSK